MTCPRRAGLIRCDCAGAWCRATDRGAHHIGPSEPASSEPRHVLVRGGRASALPPRGPPVVRLAHRGGPGGPYRPLRAHGGAPDLGPARAFLDRQGVSSSPCGAVRRSIPHCNKISGALSLAESDIGGTVVLCDTDVVVLDDPRQLELPDDAVAGSLSTSPIPRSRSSSTSLPLRASILLAPSRSPGPTTARCRGTAMWGPLPDPGPAARTGGSGLGPLGGLAVGPDRTVRSGACMSTRWPWLWRWQPRRSGRSPWTCAGTHRSTTGNGSARTPLSLRSSAVTRPSTGSASCDHRRPVARRSDRGGQRQGRPQVWERILPDEDDQGPPRASTISDDDDEQGHRRTVVAAMVAALQPASVLQIGCGDMEVVGDVDGTRYRGIDPSPDAVERARAEVPTVSSSSAPRPITRVRPTWSSAWIPRSNRPIRRRRSGRTAVGPQPPGAGGQSGRTR